MKPWPLSATQVMTRSRNARKERTMRSWKLPVLLILIAAAVFGGCARRPSDYDMLYWRLSEEPAQMDASVLEGRRIVIDPGHGGVFEGAVGPDSLSEADANLGVALYLWGLLEEAGADVKLTRTTDRDFLADSTGTAGEDLSSRMQAANSFEPEVFISIHHNSNLALDRKKNGIEVYYRGDDPVRSLELAEEIHLHLARNLGIDESVVKPGNYYVLRNSSAGASVLGEASYISHPRVEEKLKISTRQRLEAEAYYIGLISYFSRGVPLIEPPVFDGDTLSIYSTVAFRVERGAGVPVDPSTARIMIGALEIVPAWNPVDNTISCSLPPRLPNGRYDLSASIRSIRGASAVSRKTDILVSRPAEFILPLPSRRDPDGGLALSVKILDALAGPVADGTEVSVRSISPGSSWHGRCRGGKFTFNAGKVRPEGSFIITAGGRCDTLSFSGPDDPQSMTFLIRDALTGKAVGFPSAMLPDGTARTGDGSGYISLPLKLYGDRTVITARGYRPSVLEPEDAGSLADKPLILLEPLFSAVLHGKRIALDPAGGGADDYGRGPLRSRGAGINLALSKNLGRILDNAGAKVLLTREGEETLSVHERIQRANGHSPDLAVGIKFGSHEITDPSGSLILHYPGSTGGNLAALLIKGAVEGLPPCEESATGESSALFLQQTSCPAVEIHAPLSGRNEKILNNPLWIEMEANHIASAVVRYFSGDSLQGGRYEVTVTRGGAAVAGAAVCIDMALTSTTGKDGRAVFPFVDHGSHLITVDIPADAGRRKFFLVNTGADTPGRASIEVE